MPFSLDQSLDPVGVFQADKTFEIPDVSTDEQPLHTKNITKEKKTVKWQNL